MIETDKVSVEVRLGTLRFVTTVSSSSLSARARGRSLLLPTLRRGADARLPPPPSSRSLSPPALVQVRAPCAGVIASLAVGVDDVVQVRRAARVIFRVLFRARPGLGGGGGGLRESGGFCFSRDGRRRMALNRASSSPRGSRLRESRVSFLASSPSRVRTHHRKEAHDFAIAKRGSFSPPLSLSNLDDTTRARRRRPPAARRATRRRATRRRANNERSTPTS